ncbi:peptidase M24, structural domain-containing protein [Radiomyces spectabilis]|uniref:peptidase M24, structural domain-containing protein n=1 Tax=Radiomyces spectabilis TaxID=64574 RepID=UPI00221E7551|nr:peptidase M24, structural domain-containing protein [Radiomyces spectabilis]KAI8390878.1 peptidase M24, structural domain-containing protein [Radiomyces spectabilis]
MADKAPEVDNTTIANPEVITKYKDAAEIANTVLAKVIKLCVVDAKIMDICVEGDKLINEATSRIYNKGKLSKGVGFPTSISVNNCVAHFSPLPSDPEAAQTLKEGDVAKIQLDAQIDGYCSTVAHTVIVGASADKPATGVKADVVQAAHEALEAAVRLIRPGNKNMEVTKVVDQITEAYGTKAVEGMLSHQQLKNVTDGKKQIILNPSEAHLRDFARIEFAENEVYCVDILVSSGEGKVRQLNSRTTIYKKTDIRYQLKLAASRQVLSDIQAKAGSFPFSLRDLPDERKARMGIVECAKHQTVLPYDIMFEREGAVVAQFLTTLLVTKNGNIMVTNPSFDQSLVKSDKSIKDEEISKLLASPFPAVPKKNKKKKAAAPAEAAKQ